MASGFSGGGPDFYTGIGGRSIPTTTTMNPNNNQYPSSSQSPYRTQLSQIFLDQAISPNPTQIPLNRTPTSLATTQQQLQHQLFGKRTLADFQQQQHQSLSGLLNLRSVKPRTMMYQQQQQQQQQQQYSSPISTLSPIEFSSNSTGNILSPEFNSASPLSSQRYNLPILQQLRHQNHLHLQRQQQQQQQQQQLNINPLLPQNQNSYAMNTLLQQNHYNNNTNNNNVGVGGGVVPGQESENKKMMSCLQELEKQLLDDELDVEGDAISVITSTTNSEWSETIQNLFTPSSSSPSPNTVSPSPTSSSSSVTTPAPPVCLKQAAVEAAGAISEGKIDAATEILTRVSQVSNLGGNSEQRLMEYMFLALKSRVNSVDNPPPVAELYSKEHADSTQLLYELSPCFKLGFMAANLAILEATQEVDGFHVVDFDIGQGGQYVNLLHALSSRQQGKPAIGVKITAVANGGEDERERLRLIGDILSQVAERVGGASLKFNVVSCNKLGDVSRESLGCEADEALVVNFAFKLYRMPDESVSTENPRDELLRRAKGLGPRVVTLVEQEMNTNTAPFMARVNEACGYYGALFDSIESTVDNSDRVKVEEGLGRRLANSVACEGGERVERCEVFGKWRARMAMAGFALKPMSESVAESMKARLSSANRVNPGFTVKEENGGVCFGWLGKTLTVASAWR